MFTEEEKSWIEKCRAQPEQYTLFVDNDNISVYSADGDGAAFTFSAFGYTFALQLLNHIGCTAEMV